MPRFGLGDDMNRGKLRKIEDLINRAEVIAASRSSTYRELANQKRKIKKLLSDLKLVRGDIPNVKPRNFWNTLNDLDEQVGDFDEELAKLEEQAEEVERAARLKRKRGREEDSEESKPALKRQRKAPTLEGGKAGGKKLYNGKRSSLGPLDRAAVWSAGQTKSGAPRNTKACQTWRRNPACAVNVENKRDQWHADHKTPWSKVTFDVKVMSFCHEGFHYQAHYHEDSKNAYHNITNLQILCVSCNTKKGGDKGSDLDGPTKIDVCSEPAKCKLPKWSK